ESSETKMALRKTMKDVTIPKPAPGPTYAVEVPANSSRTMIKKGSRHSPVSRFFAMIIFLLCL
ncbi:MAG: hypothetical protein KAT09_05125, partial [Candidatus Aegiribacteria sp.]|nr:hypothetical protein [Candidatus Aegiribacteria sp.]